MNCTITLNSGLSIDVTLGAIISGGGGTEYDQDLNTTDDVEFNSVTLSGGDVQTQLNDKLETESDPIFLASEAANIDSQDIVNLGNLSGVNTGDQDLSGLALKSNVLGLDNTTIFTPDADYEPATKKYVDDTEPKYEAITIACSDETTDLTAADGVVEFQMPFAMTVTAVKATVTTAPTGSTIEVDINEAGTSILSTVISIDASEKTSSTAATPPVISDSSLAEGAIITVDIDQVGLTIPGTGLKVYLIGTRA